MHIHKFRPTKFHIAGLGLGLALLTQAFLPFIAPTTSAASLTKASVRLDRLATGQDTTWELDFKPATAGATSLSVNFSANWTSNSGTVSATQAIGACAEPGSDTQLPGSPTASGSGTTVSVSSITALSNATAYCEAFTTSNSLHTPTAGAYSFTVTVGSDSSTVATTIVGAGADQVTVSATVNPTFSMSLNTTADNLGTLTTSSVSTSQSPFITATVSTNAANGWYLWGKDSNAGLKSATAGNYTIPSNCSGGAGTNTTLGTNAEGYNLGASITSQGTGSGGTAATSGTGLVFDNAGGTAAKGAGLCTTYQTIANSSGTANAAVVTMKNNAGISGVTKPATDYTDLETFVGAGVF